MPSRPGKTLVELMVVIAVAAVLIAILLTAVQKIRTRAARLRDENNFRQVGLAAHGYQAQHGRLPPLTGQANMPPGYHRSEIPVTAFLLPLLEQPPAEVLWNPHTPSQLANGDPAYLGQVVPAFTSALDPSHSGGRLDGWAQPPAVGNIGFNVQVFGPKYQPCWLIDGRASLATTFPDGTTQTLLLATRRGKCGPERNAAGMAIVPGTSLWWNSGLAGHCTSKLTHGAFFGQKLPAGDGPAFQVLPSQDECDPDLAHGLHVAGVTVGLADGSTRTVRAGIDPKLWRAGLLPADGAGLPTD